MRVILVALGPRQPELDLGLGEGRTILGRFHHPLEHVSLADTGSRRRVGLIEGPQGVLTSFGFRATTRINREDFGMVFNMEMEHGGFMVGRHVHLTLNAEVDLVEE